MARLIYSGLMSLDGYIADRDGNFDWAEPDAEVHSFVNELDAAGGNSPARPPDVRGDGRLGASGGFGEIPAYIRDFADLWKATDKVVFSRTLKEVSTARTRIEREFSADAVGRLKAGAGRDLAIGGADLAGAAIRAGLVDEFQMFLSLWPWAVARASSRMTSGSGLSSLRSAGSATARSSSATPTGQDDAPAAQVYDTMGA